MPCSAPAAQAGRYEFIVWGIPGSDDGHQTAVIVADVITTLDDWIVSYTLCALLSVWMHRLHCDLMTVKIQR